MSKLFRSLLWTGFVAIGLAACGDDVTVVETPPVPPTPPGILSVQVGPDGASILVGGTQQMTAAVTTQPGAATPTIVWSTSDATKASVSTGGLVTGAGVGSAGIRATATSGTSVGSGIATVNVVAAPTCVVSSVVVTPASADMVVGQTIQASAAVNGTAQCAATVTWSSLTPAVATVNPATGLITAIAAGNAVIKATSTADATKSGSAAVTVRVPDPATLSIQSVTAGGLPIPLGAVAGQIEVALNVDKGEKVLDRVDVLIGGQVVASQTFTTAAPAAAPSAAPVTVVLNINTMQVRRPGAAGTPFVPVVGNGQSAVSANLYLVGNPTPIASNAVPVVMSNADAVIRPALTLAPDTPLPTVNPFGTQWYTGGVTWGTVNYLAFGRTTAGAAAVTGLTWGATLCGVGTSTVGGSLAAGITITGAWSSCGGLEGAVAPGTFTATVAPAGPGVGLDGSGIFAPTVFSVVGTEFTLSGEGRWNVLPTALATALSVAPASVSVDNKAPVVAVGNVAFNDLFDQPWINGTYNFLTAGDVTAPDGGSGVAAGGLEARTYANGVFVPASSGCTATPVVDGSTFSESTTSTSTDGYRICAWATDRLGNAASSGPSNYFGVDKGVPSARFITTTAVAFAGGPISTVSSTANTTIYSIAANWPAAPAFFGIEANDTRSGFHQGAALTNFPTNISQSYFNTGGTTACANTYGLPTVLVDAWVRGVPSEFNCGVGVIGYYQWSAFVTDRAGNASASFARNHANDNVAVADITNLSFGQLTYAPGTPAAFNVFGTDDLEVIEGTLALVYNGDNLGASEFTVRYPYSLFPLGTRWDGVLTNIVSGSPLTIASLIGRIDTTATATNLPSGGYATALNALPDSVYANLQDVASQPDATPLGQALNAITQFSSSTAAPWASAAAAVFGDANSLWVINSATVGVEVAIQRTGTSVTVPYFDSVNLYGVVGGELVLCGTYGAPVLTDNGVFRTWTYSVSTPAGSNACVGATAWRAGGVKGNAVMLTQQVAP